MRDSDSHWEAYPGQRSGIEVIATDPPLHRLGFDLRSRKEIEKEQRRLAKQNQQKKKSR